MSRRKSSQFGGVIFVNHTRRIAATALSRVPSSPKKMTTYEIEASRAEMKRSALSHVLEVVELCITAGLPNHASAFLRRHLSVSQVRERLQNLRADGDERSQIDNKVGVDVMMTKATSAKSGHDHGWGKLFASANGKRS